MFRKLGFACVDDQTGATLAALHNQGWFSAGWTLVGSHAYGAILNRLGVNAKSVSLKTLMGSGQTYLQLINVSTAGKPALLSKLGTDAQAVSYLDHLVEDRMTAVALSKNYVVPIYVPTPARFAVHRLFSSQSSTNQFAKSEKAIRQAATLICVVEERYPGDIAEAMAIFPLRGRAMLVTGAMNAMPLLHAHNAQIAEAIDETIREAV